MDNLSNYLENISFINWVFDPANKELDLFWKKYGMENPEEEKNIQAALKIVLQFRTATKSLSEKEKILLFSRVLKQIEERQKSGKTRQIFTALAKYAAVAILFFSIGALLFYRPTNINPAFHSFNFQERIPEHEGSIDTFEWRECILG